MSAVLLLLGALAATPAISQDLGLKHGEASLNSGKYDAAVRQLSATVNDPDSTPDQIARALYLRGVAYRRMGNPARAISDIGAAVWLGLPGSDKARALVNKGLAYRAVGLSSQAEAAISQARRSSGGVDRIIAEESRTAVASADTSPLSDGAVGESTWSRLVPSVPSVGSLVPSFGSSSSSSASAPAAEPAPQQAPQSEQTATRTAAAAPTTGWNAEVAEESASQGNAVSRWFGSLTGDSTPAPSSIPAPTVSSAPTTTTASRTAAAPRAAPPPPPSAESWAANTSAQREEESGTAVGRWFSRQISSTPSEPAAAPRGSGYTVQLANSSSPSDAQALWKKAKAVNPQIASATPRIEKVDIGDFGTFYTVKIGPYPTSAESTKVCNALKRGGTDCSVVAPDGP
jgi:tetratricopeptide (TPR) repeat protein